jgi:IS605 OrfB family transposase
MESGNIKYTRKIRIYPTSDMKKYLSKCFGTSRYIYNKTIKNINDDYETQKKKFTKQAKKSCIYVDNKKNRCNNNSSDKSYFCATHVNKKIKWNTDLSKINLRNKIVRKNNDISDTDTDKWLKNIPYDTRQLAVFDAITATKSAITNKKRGNIDKFQLGYQNYNNQYCNFEKRCLNLKKLMMFPRSFKQKFRLRTKMKKWCNKHINKINSNFQIVRERPNRFYLCLVFEKPTTNEEKTYNCVALDPGKRTFQTFYSSEGVCGKLGDNLYADLKVIHKQVDQLKAFKDNYNISKGTKRNIRQKCLRLTTKIKNTVKDFHWKAISFLCKHFSIIMIPQFETSNMVKKATRNIRRSTARAMLSLSHYQFLQRLKHKAQMLGNKLIICDEHYTSKTCGKCGTLNENLKGRRIFVCPKCAYTEDRDIHGARNIFIKTMGILKNKHKNRVRPSPSNLTKLSLT